MDLFMILFDAVLFFVLTPGIFVTLPPKAGKKMVAATHAIIFAVVWSLSHKMVWNMSRMFEGMSAPVATPPTSAGKSQSACSSAPMPAPAK